MTENFSDKLNALVAKEIATCKQDLDKLSEFDDDEKESFTRGCLFALERSRSLDCYEDLVRVNNAAKKDLDYWEQVTETDTSKRPYLTFFWWMGQTLELEVLVDDLKPSKPRRVY